MPCFFGCVLLRDETVRSYSWAIKCSNNSCRVEYHPLCAPAAGLCVELENEDRLYRPDEHVPVIGQCSDYEPPPNPSCYARSDNVVEEVNSKASKAVLVGPSSSILNNSKTLPPHIPNQTNNTTPVPQQNSSEKNPVTIPVLTPVLTHVLSPNPAATFKKLDLALEAELNAKLITNNTVAAFVDDLSESSSHDSFVADSNHLEEKRPGKSFRSALMEGGAMPESSVLKVLVNEELCKELKGSLVGTLAREKDIRRVKTTLYMEGFRSIMVTHTGGNMVLLRSPMEGDVDRLLKSKNECLPHYFSDLKP
ncbi:hypothetical protein P8452_53214 [Trifolium repens]|nr:hypothetical protein P8452_53214 [Trifolium repens]